MRTRRTQLAALAAASALLLAGCGGGDAETDPPAAGGEETEEGGGTEGSNGAEGGGGAEGSLTIGIKFDQPGLGFQEGSEYTGFDVDVARYVAEQLGYGEDQIEWFEAPSNQRENLLSGANPQVDMIFATYSITDARRESVDFAGPYFVAGQDLLVAAENDDIAGPDDLEGKRLCSVTGSTSAERIRDEYSAGVQLQEYPGYADCVTALVAGAIDAVTTDDVILAGLAAQPQNAGNVKVVGNPFSEENYGVGLPKGSDQCEAINEAITQMIEDGTWEELLEKNVGESGYTPNEELNPPTPEPCA